MNFNPGYIFVPLVILIILVSGTVMSIKAHECEDAGGTYVKTWTGFHKCIGENDD